MPATIQATESFSVADALRQHGPATPLRGSGWARYKLDAQVLMLRYRRICLPMVTRCVSKELSLPIPLFPSIRVLMLCFLKC